MVQTNNKNLPKPNRKGEKNKAYKPKKTTLFMSNFWAAAFSAAIGKDAEIPQHGTLQENLFVNVLTAQGEIGWDDSLSPSLIKKPRKDP